MAWPLGLAAAGGSRRRSFEFAFPVLTAVEQAQDGHALVVDGERDGHASLEADNAKAGTDMVIAGPSFGSEFETVAEIAESNQIAESRV
jgi:hypothetical protein